MAKKAIKRFEGDVLIIEVPETGESVSIDLNDLSDDMKLRLVKHGLSQKVGDSYAGAPAEEIAKLAGATIERLKADEWGVERGEGKARTTQLAEALAAATGKSVEECVAKLDEMEDEQKKALRAHPQIKAELAKIKAQKAAEAAKKAEAEQAEAAPLNF